MPESKSCWLREPVAVPFRLSNNGRDAERSDKESRLWASQDNGLIAAHSSSAVVRMRITTAKGQIAFGANDKESERRMQSVKALEIDEAAVHDDE